MPGRACRQSAKLSVILKGTTLQEILCQVTVTEMGMGGTSINSPTRYQMAHVVRQSKLIKSQSYSLVQIRYDRPIQNLHCSHVLINKVVNF
jgi:hypothetical protein